VFIFVFFFIFLLRIKPPFSPPLIGIGTNWIVENFPLPPPLSPYYLVRHSTSDDFWSLHTSLPFGKTFSFKEVLQKPFKFLLHPHSFQPTMSVDDAVFFHLVLGFPRTSFNVCPRPYYMLSVQLEYCVAFFPVELDPLYCSFVMFPPPPIRTPVVPKLRPNASHVCHS